ncbi:MAG: hypothetical protein Q8O67_27510 [Deltaproteobacteria bacterium]|nr:hypothetical protein [Deltaproteobacteria bacterium]
MLVSVAACALVAALRFDVALVTTAQAPPSNVETFIVPWLGARVGALDNDDEGLFKGVDGQVLLGIDSQGTNEVSVLRVPVLFEGRGLIGGRWRGGLVGIGGYGFGGVGGGVGIASFKAFDDNRVRGFGLWSVRGGGGVDLGFGSVFTRIELGVGVRDLRPEVSGTFAVGSLF